MGQYLSHEGYTETINAFSDEVKSSISHLRGPEAAEASSIVYKEDPNAVKRQRRPITQIVRLLRDKLLTHSPGIRSAVLEGKVQEAIDLTDNYYPTVLRDNENIYFKLRCRKFIELIKKSTDLQPRSKRPSTSSTLTRHSKSGSLGMGTNGHAHMSRDDLTRMDVDVENGAGAETAIVDASPSEGVYLQQSNLMNEALMYGRKLQNEFKDDPRREVKQALEDTFALIAYPDARDSSLAHLLEDQGRVPVAEELNSAILGMFRTLLSLLFAGEHANRHRCSLPRPIFIRSAREADPANGRPLSRHQRRRRRRRAVESEDRLLEVTHLRREVHGVA